MAKAGINSISGRANDTGKDKASCCMDVIFFVIISLLEVSKVRKKYETGRVLKLRQMLLFLR